MCLEGNFSGGESSYWLISKGISSMRPLRFIFNDSSRVHIFETVKE